MPRNQYTFGCAIISAFGVTLCRAEATLTDSTRRVPFEICKQEIVDELMGQGDLYVKR